MSTDPTIARLRKTARECGWTVSTVTRAKRRPPIDLVAERVYREPWTPGNMSQRQIWQRIEVRLDAFAEDGLYISESFDSGRYPQSRSLVELEQALRRQVPTAAPEGVS